jgi:hypothetical protein
MADHLYHLPGLLGQVCDRRARPRLSTLVVLSSVLLLFLTRRRSLHALEQTRGQRFWRRWLRGPAPSADTVARVLAQIEASSLRPLLYALYHQFRRKKVLLRPGHGLMAVILDGHESSCSYRRHRPECLQRRAQVGGRERIQFYHRNVTALLQIGSFSFLLDAEAQRPGEDEVSAAQRLFLRLVRLVPRAFDVVLVDGLYTRTGFFRMVQAHGKEVIAVLKENRPDLLQDARDLFATLAPREEKTGRTTRLSWDEAGFTSWPEFPQGVRVIRSLESTTSRPSLESGPESQPSDWFWVTTLSPLRASTQTVIALGHTRWAIENQGFNELTRYWHADHVFHHRPRAIEAFWLLAMLAYNLFHAFVARQIHPPLRRRHTRIHWAEVLAAALYRDEPVEPWGLPP